MTLCKYKDIFGKPNEGVHSYRVFGVASVDLVLTILVAFVIKYFVPSWSFILIIISLFILAIIVHKLFCVETALNKFIFGTNV